jgi:hypothetical protein
MSDNSPYEPPRAPLQDPQQRKTRPNLLAIVIGSLVDVVSTTVVGTLFSIGFAVMVGSEGMKPEQFQELLQGSSAFMFTAYALGLACSVLGGYICARFANQNEYANGLAVGIIGVISGELMSSGGGEGWMHVLGLLTIPAALLGAHIKMRRDKSLNEPG